jgi:hypothetical protein
MSTSSRRRKAPPVADGRVTFTITIDAQEMRVDYKPHWMPDLGHFEFRSPHEPPRPIPISETGYRSEFAPMADVEAAASPQDFAREVALDLLRSETSTAGEDEGQLSLF